MLKQYHNNATQGDGLFKKLPKLLIIKLTVAALHPLLP